MAEYIDRAEVISIIKTGGFWEEEDREVAITCVEQTPAAEVAEVRHGRWISTGVISCKCSDCGKLQLKSHADDSNYCPNCGARMDKEDEQ